MISILLRASLCAALISPSAGTAQSFDSAQGYYESAIRMLSAGELTSAAIQLKNALQINPDHVPSLVELGRTQYTLGEVAEAMQLLEEALLLGADPKLAAEPLARSYLQLGEFARLRQRLPLEQLPIEAAVLRAAHAQALIAQDRLTEASVLIESSLHVTPGSLDLKLAKITLHLREGHFDQALETSQELITAHAGDSRSWNAYASALHAYGRFSEASAAYQQALELNQYNADARIALISLLLDNEDDSAALKSTLWMREHIPADPRAAYFEGLLAARRGDADAEVKALTEAMATFDSIGDERLAADPQLQMLAALTYYGRGAFEMARDLLRTYVAGHRSDSSAARLLASTLLKIGEYDEAVQLLGPYHRRTPEDADTAILLSSALNAAGKPLQAARLLESVPGIGRGQGDGDRQLAIALLDAGETHRGATLLAHVYDNTTLSTGQNLELALAYLRDRNWDDALQLLGAESPTPLISNLRAIALVGLGERDAAETQLREITKTNQEFFPAWANLARLQREAGNLDEAERSLMKALNVAPDEPRLQYEIALTHLTRGSLTEALRHAERAAEAAPRDIQFVSLEVNLQFQLEKPRAALDAALRAATSDGAPASMQRLLAATQARAGSSDQALITLQRAARGADFDAPELHAIANMQIALGAYSAALGSLDNALKGNPSHVPAKQSRIQALIGNKLFVEAEAAAAQLAQNRPTDVDSQILLGEALMAARKPRAALDTFISCEQQDGGDVCIIGQLDALEALGQFAEARELLAHYIEAGGSHPGLKGHYSDLLIASENWAAALPVLRDLSDSYPARATVLNNLALAQFYTGNEEALKTAERAHALEENNPMINDTLGWLLFKEGRSEEALGFLREASTRASDSPEIRFHLAAALADLGRSAEALRELESALNPNFDYPGKQDAVDLRRELVTTQ